MISAITTSTRSIITPDDHFSAPLIERAVSPTLGQAQVNRRLRDKVRGIIYADTEPIYEHWSHAVEVNVNTVSTNSEFVTKSYSLEFQYIT